MLGRGLGDDAVAEVEDERPDGKIADDRSAASRIATPPATTSSGSRLPCTAPKSCSASRATAGGNDVSRLTAVTPVAAK